jgi:adenylate cyclase class IV
VEKSTGAKIVGNTVKAAGNYGILFNQTVQSNGSNNKITGSKNYDLNYSNNSKNKKSNLKFQRISASAGKTAVTGHTTVGLTVSVTVKGKTKTQKTKPNGDFSIAVAKLKKGAKITIQVKDSLNNVATKNITVK